MCVHVCVIDVLLSLCACQNGYTALMWAAKKGNTEIAVALVEKGANMDVQDNWVRWQGDCYVTFAKSVYVQIIRVEGF